MARPKGVIMSLDRLNGAVAAESARSRTETTLADAVGQLVEMLPRLAAALERQADGRPCVQPLVYRIDELVRVLGVSRRAIERERSAGRFPAPDLLIGKMPLWRVESISRFLEGGGSK